MAAVRALAGGGGGGPVRGGLAGSAQAADDAVHCGRHLPRGSGAAGTGVRGGAFYRLGDVEASQARHHAPSQTATAMGWRAFLPVVQSGRKLILIQHRWQRFRYGMPNGRPSSSVAWQWSRWSTLVPGQAPWRPIPGSGGLAANPVLRPGAPGLTGRGGPPVPARHAKHLPRREVPLQNGY
jgi:hypothetical protein